MKKILLLLFLSTPCFAALSASTVYEVETGGSDSNGGGFVTGSGGTDWSQQSAAHVAFNGTSITATTTGAATLITITGYTVLAGDVGNLLQITGGTNFLTGIYQITSVNTGANTWTLDRNVTSGVGAAMTGNMGGAFLTIQQALTNQSVQGQNIYIKGGTYTITTGLTQSAGAFTFNLLSRIIGYSSVRGDNGRPIVATTSAITMLAVSVAGVSVENLEFNGNNDATAGITLTGTYQNSGINLNVHNIAGIGVTLSSNGGGLFNSVVSTCTSGGVDTTAIGVFVDGNTVYGNTTYGINSTTNGDAFIRNVIFNNSTTGINAGSYADAILYNDIYNNGSDGILEAYQIVGDATGNIIVNNGGWGINMPGSTPSQVASYVRNNAYYNNTSGNLRNAVMGFGDVLLTGVPFTNPISDFSLNNTAGAGAACRLAGFPGTLVTGGSGSLDIGTLQHAYTAGAGTKGYVFTQ